MKIATTGRVLAGACLALIAGLTVATCPAVASPAVADPVPVAPPLPFPVPPAPPFLDPAFYNPDPARVAAAAPGEILSARQVNLANFWLIPLDVRAWQLSYRSTDTHGEAIPAVATVIVPHRPAPTGSAVWSPSSSPRIRCRRTARRPTPCRWDRCRTRSTA